MHMYPNRSQSKSALGCSRYSLNYFVIPAINYLEHVMDEIHWDDRLSPYNHTPHFPLWFVGAVDTFPLRVLTPISSHLRKALFNPKYGQVCLYTHSRTLLSHHSCVFTLIYSVYKAQVGINFLGEIVICTGPHLGVCYDGHIWKRTGAGKMLPWEWWLGDGAYPL
jgi:hypothetical protein